jgi:hypothetical protein
MTQSATFQTQMFVYIFHVELERKVQQEMYLGAQIYKNQQVAFRISIFKSSYDNNIPWFNFQQKFFLL